MSVATLTDALVERLVCPAGCKHWEVFDLLIRGLYVDVQPSGRITYRLRYRQEGRQRHLTLGDARLMTLQEARTAARDKLRQFHAGVDLKTGAVSSAGKTVSDLLVNQYLPYVKSYKRSWQTDESMIRIHILPQIGAFQAGALSTTDVARMVDSMKNRNYALGTINRMLVLLRFAYSLALRWKVEGVEFNPLKEFKNLKNDNKIERYLTPMQTSALMAAVKNSLNPMLQFIVPFMIYTGARKREALNARWVDIDWAQKSWRIPKTKSGLVRHVPLSVGALALLSQRQSDAAREEIVAEYIFPNARTGGPFVTIFHSWDTARKQADVPQLRIHDLRHSFASFLVNAGRSLYEVQELLGHSDIRTTSRYAHLSRERLSEAVEVIKVH